MDMATFIMKISLCRMNGQKPNYLQCNSENKVKNEKSLVMILKIIIF